MATVVSKRLHIKQLTVLPPDSIYCATPQGNGTVIMRANDNVDTMPSYDKMSSHAMSDRQQFHD